MAKRIYRLKGFPEVGAHIPAPNIAELLTMPIYARACRDYFLETCHPFQRLLYESCPITNRFQNISVDSYVQLIEPDTCPINIRYKGGWLHEWHIDGIWNMFEEEREETSTFHIYMSKCDARTAFNANPNVEVEIDEDMDHMEFSELANMYWKEWGIEPVKAEPERIVTFTTHIHTSTPPKRREFRYFFRVTESNYIESRANKDSIINKAVVNYFDRNGKVMQSACVVQMPNGIFLPKIVR